jgi:hypothetical protein
MVAGRCGKRTGYLSKASFNLGGGVQALLDRRKGRDEVREMLASGPGH